MSRFVRISTAAYWPVILSTALSQAGNIRAAAKRAGDDVMFMPYKNVIRMHLMIFVIAFMSIGGLHAYVLYAALFVYFFPLEDIFRKKFDRTGQADDGRREGQSKGVHKAAF